MLKLTDATRLSQNQQIIAFFPHSMRCGQQGTLQFIPSHNCQLQGGKGSCVGIDLFLYCIDSEGFRTTTTFFLLRILHHRCFCFCLLCYYCISRFFFTSTNRTHHCHGGIVRAANRMRCAFLSSVSSFSHIHSKLCTKHSNTVVFSSLHDSSSSLLPHCLSYSFHPASRSSCCFLHDIGVASVFTCRLIDAIRSCFEPY